MVTDRAPCIQARIRSALQSTPALTSTLQIGRAILHFGPWRHAIRELIRRARPPREAVATGTFCLLQLDIPQIVENLRADGMAMAGRLRPDELNRVRAVTDELPPGEYGDFHEEVPDIRVLLQSAAVLGVVRGYLRAEPELLECNLVVAHAEKSVVPLKKTSQRFFHFDFAGWHSLNLFIYLTDVAEDSGAHQVIARTHFTRNMWDAIRPSVPDSEIYARYDGRVRTVTGPAGTMFFEDTSAFHRRKTHTRRRVMLNILYASHRSWLSKGRLTLKYSDYLRIWQ